MSAVTGFPPVVGNRPSVLILGSMPGTASLERTQYYGHPRNAFWPIMGELVGAAPQLAYPDRLARLTDSGIALWDVLEHCVRPGSLDARISAAQPNDFGEFFDRHPTIRHVFFNGRKAAELFERRVLPGLDGPGARWSLATLPSTSPAHAALSPAEKTAQWQVVHDALLHTA